MKVKILIASLLFSICAFAQPRILAGYNTDGSMKAGKIYYDTLRNLYTGEGLYNKSDSMIAVDTTQIATRLRAIKIADSLIALRGGGISYPYSALKYLTGYGTFGSFNDSARAAISLTTTGTSGAATYNSATGVLNIPQYSGSGGSTGWALNGNAATAGDATGDFLGTTNNVSLRFRTNNTQRIVLDSLGNLKMGTTTASSTATPLQLNLGGALGTNTAGTTGNLKLLLYDDGASSKFGFGMSSSTMEIQAASSSSIKFYQGGTLVSTMTSLGLGVGAGGATNYQLGMGSNLANTKLAVYENGGNVFGFGIQANQFRLHTSSASDRFSFMSAPAGTEVFTVTGGGKVGVGNSSPNASMDVVGSFGAAITTVTANTTLDATHYTVLCNATSGNITITLPAASSTTQRRVYIIKKIDSSANTVTFTTAEGTQTLSTQWSGKQVQATSANWYITGSF